MGKLHFSSQSGNAAPALLLLLVARDTPVPKGEVLGCGSASPRGLSLAQDQSQGTLCLPSSLAQHSQQRLFPNPALADVPRAHCRNNVGLQH